MSIPLNAPAIVARPTGSDPCEPLSSTSEEGCFEPHAVAPLVTSSATEAAFVPECQKVATRLGGGVSRVDEEAEPYSDGSFEGSQGGNAPPCPGPTPAGVEDSGDASDTGACEQTEEERPSYLTETGEHILRRRWQFLARPRETRRKGQSSSHDWQKDMTLIGSCVGTVERFWIEMNEVFRRTSDGNVFMFREGIQPMWEDPAFAHGGSVNFSFSGPDYAENARQAFLLACLLTVGAQFDPEEEAVLCGCTFGWKQGLCRIELWLSTDKLPLLNAVAGKFLVAMQEFHTEFFRSMATRVSYDCKAFKAGGDKRIKADETTIEKIVSGVGAPQLRGPGFH